MKKNIKKVFNEIEKIRSKNNKNWMNLLRLSYDVKPKETIEIIIVIVYSLIVFLYYLHFCLLTLA